MTSVDRQRFEADYTPAELSALALWFDSRDVYTPRFLDWWERYTDLSYNRYSKMLRIDPGFGHYDWLVSHYREYQRTLTQSGSTTGSTTSTGGGSSTETTKPELKTVVDVDQVDYAVTTPMVRTVVTTDNTDSRTVTPGVITTTTTEGSGSSAISGDPTSTKTTKTDGYTDGIELAKTNPMSIVYDDNLKAKNINAGNVGSNVVTLVNNSDAGATLNWTNPSTQGEAVGRSATAQTESNSDHLDQTTTSSDRQTVTVTPNPIVPDREQTDTDGTVTTEQTGSDSVRTQRYSGKMDNPTRADWQTTTESGKTTTERSDNTNSSTNTLDTRDLTDLEQIQETGRDGQIAEMLAEARDYLIHTSAFRWLVHELEPAFIGIYSFDDIDLYGEIDDPVEPEPVDPIIEGGA